MKCLVIFDLADQSTREVGQGMMDGLTFLGHEVKALYLNKHIDYLLRPFGTKDVRPEARRVVMGVLQDLIIAAVTRLRPDMVLVVSGWGVAPSTVDLIRSTFKTQTVLYLTESPYLSQEQYELMSNYDLVLNNELCNMAEVEAHHDNVVYFPHSYNPEIHYPKSGSVPSGIDVFMCATGFSERVQKLESVDWDGVNLCLTGFWPEVGKNSALCQFANNRIMLNKDLPSLYKNSAINLNIHRTSRVWNQDAGAQEHITETADSLGPRVYEILASGGFLLTDHRAEADSFLVDGQDYVTYSGADDLQEKISFFLLQPDVREQIAANGVLAVQNCTFAERCRSILIPQLEVINSWHRPQYSQERTPTPILAAAPLSTSKTGVLT